MTTTFLILSAKGNCFFLKTPLRINRPGSKLYKQFLAFDRPFPLPAGIRLPRKQRGFAVLNDGTVKWYKNAESTTTGNLLPGLHLVFCVCRRITAGACRICVRFSKVGNLSAITSKLRTERLNLVFSTPRTLFSASAGPPALRRPFPFLPVESRISEYRIACFPPCPQA